MDLFVEWFAGEWNNKIQHFRDINKHTLVTITHDYLGDGVFLFTQKRFNEVYRTGHYKMNFTMTGHVLMENYDLNMEYKEGCDILFSPKKFGEIEAGKSKAHYHGVPNGDCRVIMNGQETLFRTDAKLFADKWMVWDRGFDPIAPGRMIWGSSFGPYIFRRPDFNEEVDDS